MKWYHYFNRENENSLLSRETISPDDLIVCQQLQTRRYTKFDSFASFSRFFHTLPEDEKCFYEMLLPEKPRKPYFDIDMGRSEITDHSEKDFLRMVKKAISDMLAKEAKILIFSSHTPSKFSYHIIVDSFILQSQKELVVFFERVLERIEDRYKQFFDKSVYKSVQQFRIVGSHKFGKPNEKTFLRELSKNFKYPPTCREKIAKFNYLLSCSLISNNGYCTLLGGFAPPEEDRPVVFGSAEESDVEDVLRLFYSKYSMGDFQYHECKEKNGNLLVVLKRLNATYCEECDRVHENENPFLVVFGQFRNVSFYCRRRDGVGGVSLGSLGIKEMVEMDEKEVPNIEEMTRKQESSILLGDDFEEVEEVHLDETLEDISERHIKRSTPVKRVVNAKKQVKGIKLGKLIH